MNVLCRDNCVCVVYLQRKSGLTRHNIYLYIRWYYIADTSKSDAEWIGRNARQEIQYECKRKYF